MSASTTKAHTRVAFRYVLKQVAEAYPDGDLHLVMDNYSTHKTREIRDWLEANPRIYVHFIPVSSS